MFLNPFIRSNLLFFFDICFWKPRTFDNRGRYQVEILRNSGTCSAPARGFIDETWMKQRRRRESWQKKSCRMNVPLKQLPSEASSSFFLLYTQSQWSFGRWFGHSQSWPQKKVWPNKLLKNCPATTDHGHAKTYAHLWNSKLGIWFLFIMVCYWTLVISVWILHITSLTSFSKPLS